MTEHDEQRKDPRERPDDPAGTKPKVDSDALLPEVREPLVAPVVDATAFEEGDEPDYLPERVGGAGAPAPYIHPPESPRFQFLLGALFALGLAAVAGVVALALRGDTNGRDNSWSLWHPNGKDPAGQIASHVGLEYRLGNGDQLVAVTGGPLEVAGLPLTIALRAPADKGGDISLVDGKGVLYRLCGLGKNCSIPEGKPSIARHLLLRREALELALYTFHYTDADNVVTFMPPATIKPIRATPAAAKTAKPKTVTQALFFRRSDVGVQLQRPLATTLTRTAPRPATVTDSPDASFVNQITEARLFSFTLTQANQDSRAFLVLQQ